MPRKPVHLSASAKRPEGRQVIWEAIRKLRKFKIANIEEATYINESTIKTYVKGLTNAGYLARCDRRELPKTVVQRYEAGWWELVNDVGVDAPRVTRDGKEVTQGLGREQMWRTMRIIGDFNYRELAVQASIEGQLIKESEAKYYCMFLHRAGYLACVAGATVTSTARYRLIKARYTGPRAPQIQNIKQVWDPNTQQVVWQPQEADDE